MSSQSYYETLGVAADASFIERHERFVVPIMVLLATLLTVAFGPILMGVRAG